jgi:hypothetical protein
LFRYQLTSCKRQSSASGTSRQIWTGRNQLARAHTTHETDCNSRARYYSGTLLLLAIAGLLTACGGGGGGGSAPKGGSTTFLTDNGIHPPPTTGTSAYDTFKPGTTGFPAVGGTYTDPVFGSVVRRLTNQTGNTNCDDIYAHHWANANGTLAFTSHMDSSGNCRGPQIVKVATGLVVFPDQPDGLNSSENYWDANDPDAYYYYRGGALMRRHLAAQSDEEMKDFGLEVTTGPISLTFSVGGSSITRPASGSFFADGFVAGSTIIVNGTVSNDGLYTINTITPLVITVAELVVSEGPVSATITTALQENGGSLNIQSRDGRYFTVRYNGTNKVWDSQTPDTIYSGSVTPLDSGGWVSITPDGNYLVTAAGPTPEPDTEHWSYPIDHSTMTIGSTPTQFWGLCGDHGDLVSASDGKNYFVTFECTNIGAVYRVDIALNQAGKTPAQQAAANQILVPLAFSSDGHFSAVSKGALADWVFMSTETDADAFDGGVSGWTAYEQEIIAMNTVTLEVRRLAHHRSRGLAADYQTQPRVSSSWDGSVVMWASNFNVNSPIGYADLYAIQSPL